jgi:hypothetical protein
MIFKKYLSLSRESFAVLVSSFFFGGFLLLIITPTLSEKVILLTSSVKGEVPDNESLVKSELLLMDKLERCRPAGAYLVINTTLNQFQLYNKRELVREGVCSTGSYTKLVKSDEESWLFKTPKGVFRIQSKITNPLWRKPDWYFVESGLPVPPAGHPSRFEYGVLGDYALSLGSGYLIHGTLYQRFLGLSVTHGCVRIGDEDLESIFKTMPVGARVYIF